MMRFSGTSLLLLFVLGLSLGCSAAPTSISSTAVPTTAPGTAAPAASATAAADAPAPGATPTLHPAIIDATLPFLARRNYPASAISIVRVLSETATSRESLVSYVSDGIRVSGVLNEPVGSGPFPAVVLAHGYYEPAEYTSGMATQRVARVLSENGYVAFAPDYRGYGDSGHGMNLYMSGYIADVLSAGASLKLRANVDPNRVGLWGHSMGGGIATRAAVVSDLFRSIVIYAPISADEAEMVMDPMGGETVGMDTELAMSLLQSINDENLLNALSPKNYYDRVTAPISIHSGLADEVCPTSWAEGIYRGLKQAGKRAEFYTYPGEGHVISGGQQNLFDSRVLNFFGQTLK